MTLAKNLRKKNVDVENKDSNVMNITALAVRRPVATSMVFVALSLLGAVSYYLLPVQLLPNLVLPQLRMVVWMPGATSDEIEEKLVMPAESAIASLEGIESIRSWIYEGRADIWISFNHGTDMRYAYLKLEQRAGVLRKEIPEQARLEVLRYDTTDLANILMQLVVGGPGDLDRLRNVADEEIVPALESVDGVVNVMAFGGKEYAVEVIVDEDKCEAAGVPIFAVTQTIAAFNRRTEYLGDITDKGIRYFVSLTGRFSNITDLRELPVGPNGQVLLKDVAEVRFGRKDADRISRIDGEPAVMLLVRKDDMANMLRVARNVYREIDRLNRDLVDHGVEVKIVVDAAELIADSIRKVKQLACVGVALALGVLLIFLKRLRTVSIVLIAIPVSLLVTFNLLYCMELSINLLSLAGFAFAIGLLVDNSVVVIENTFRRVTRVKDGITAAIEGTTEVVKPIIAMTGTTLIVFLPVFFLENTAFRMIIEQFVYSIGSPLVVSVFVSLTLVPMLAARTVDRRVAAERKHNRFIEIYVTILKAVLRRRAFTMVMTIVLFFFTLIVCLIPTLLFSVSQESVDQIDCRIDFPRGTSLESASRLTAQLEDICRQFPDVKMVHSVIEREQAQVVVEFLDPKDRSVELDIGGIRNQIKKKVETIEGLGLERVKFSGDSERIDEETERESKDVFAGSSSQEYIEVRGQDTETLERIALQIEQRLRRAFGDYLSYTRTDIEPGGPELEVRGRRSILDRWGLTMSDLANVVWMARPGGDQLIVPFRSSDEDIDILVRLKDGKTRTIADLEQMRLRTPDGHYIELNEVAEFKLSEAAKRVVRRDQQHAVRVFYAFRGDIAGSARRLDTLRAQVDEVIGAMQMPQGYVPKIVHEQEKDPSMKWALIAAPICVFLLLAALFEDGGTPLCVMTTFPLAVIGVLWGLLFTQTGLVNPMVLVGLIMLVGVVVNDAILTLGQARLLLRRGYRRTRAVLEGGRNRLRPVMMTTATTVLAMLPLAIRKGGETEIWPPFAITVIFGLAASTFGTLVFVPAMYLSLRDIGRWMKSIRVPALAVGTAAVTALVGYGFMRLLNKTAVGATLKNVVVSTIAFGGEIMICIACTIGTILVLAFIFATHWSLKRIARPLKSVYMPGFIIAAAATWALFYFGFMRAGWVESWVWRTVLAPTAFFAAAAIVWVVMRLVTTVTHVSVFEGEDVHISITNLTKIFGADKPIVRDWKKRRRREMGMRARGEPIVNKRHVREDLVWKVPLCGLLVYFHIYFDNPFWLFVTACATWVALYDLVRSLGMLVEGDAFFDIDRHPSRVRRAAWGAALRLPTCALACYFYWRLEAQLWFAIVFLIVGLILHWLHHLAGRARRGEIDTSGRKGFLSRLTRAALRIPVVAGVKPRVHALTGVNLDIGKGMFGLLGPNGAGKTTLMRILCNIYEPSRGCVEINGRNIRHLRADVQPIIGYLPQHFGLYENFTVWDYLNYFALLNDIFDKDERQTLVEKAIGEVHLDERKHDKISSLSGGMKQRVGIAQTLLRLPKIIVVDEPTAGLDPMERIRFRNLLAELGKDRIVVFSTHITEDVMSACHDLAVLNEGRVVFRGAPEELQRMADGRVREAVVDVADVHELTARVHVVSQVAEPGGVRVRFIIRDAGQQIGDTVAPTLEDAYLWLLKTAQETE